MKNRDALYREQTEILAELRGIAPKHPLYLKLKARLDEITNELGGQIVKRKIMQTAGRRSFIPDIGTSIRKDRIIKNQ